VEAPAVESPSAAVATRSQGGSGEFEDYSVQTGDTLMKIAFETYGDLYRWREIYEANRERIADPNNVPRGTVLKLERPSSPVTISRNGDKFTIRPGDTLGTISQEVYGTPRKWRKIYNNNRELIKDPNRIYAGFTLYYTMDEEDRREMNTPQPLAEAQPAVDPSRFPASAENAPVPAVQAMPGAATAEVPPPAAMAPQTMAPAGAQ
jgi:LysM repeat protein